MNTSIRTEQSVYDTEEQNEMYDNITFGDVFAFSLIGMYTLSALVVSCWSAILLLTGNTSSGGPIGLIFTRCYHQC